MKKIKIIHILLILSLIINILLFSIYFLKLNPDIKQLKEKLAIAEKSNVNENCTRVYSGTQGKFICLTKEQQKSIALSECSKNFREGLTEKIFNSLKSISDLEKLRDLSIRMCMQEKGFDY